jgi:heme-degrading monooxygenase HmoA
MADPNAGDSGGGTGPSPATPGAPTPGALAEGQVVTVFRSRLRAGIEEEYGALAAEMLTAARQAPGFVDFKSFAADDGERVSVITFASAEAHAKWRDHLRHRQAQERGRSALYAEYSIQVGSCTHVRRWRREAD